MRLRSSSVGPFVRVAPVLRLAGLVLLGLLAPAAAPALTIADVLPLYFDGVDGQGFDPAAVAGREVGFRVATELSRALHEHVTLAARWRYVDNRSTSDVFDYEQHVLGVYLTLGGRIDL